MRNIQRRQCRNGYGLEQHDKQFVFITCRGLACSVVRILRLAHVVHYCVAHFCVIQLCAMKNPFEFGRELGIGELVDRNSEVAEVEEVIRSGRKLFLIGPRRYGKTSILKAAEDKLQVANSVVLRLDAESYPTLEMLVNRIVAWHGTH